MRVSGFEHSRMCCHGSRQALPVVFSGQVRAVTSKDETVCRERGPIGARTGVIERLGQRFLVVHKKQRSSRFALCSPTLSNLQVRRRVSA